MRNDGQMFGSGFHNTEERQGLGVATTEADVFLKKFLEKFMIYVDICKIQETAELSISCFG